MNSQSIGNNSAWDHRASANTISQMTNPFRTNAYGAGMMSQNDMSGFSQIRHNERPQMQDELSSPDGEENL
jgi:hypothetical protein